MTKTLETLFERYRTQGDVGALGEVFDRTADELFRIGVHLSRDPLAAEDLLQQTFVEAIERRDRYDAGRPLIPWLTGILSNMARRRWRDTARRPDPYRITWPDTDNATAAQGELEDEVFGAVERLQPPYREVVHFHLRFDLKPAEIAHLTDREPGTVRSQLQRGLEKLRARLPTSLAGTLVPAMRGLGPIRELVLMQAGASAVTAATSSGVGASGLLFAGTKLGVGALVLLLLLALGAFLTSECRGPTAGTPVELAEVVSRGSTRNEEESGPSSPRRGGGPERPSSLPAAPQAEASTPGVPGDPAPTRSSGTMRSGGTISMSSDIPASVAAGIRLQQRLVQRTVIPALLWAMETRNSGHQDTESAAYIALAKVTRDPAHIQTIRSGLDKTRRLEPVVRESAALALGLLRRSRSWDRFSVGALDGVRAFLFQVFEDEDYQPRTRGFAAIALGLLGDQPTAAAQPTTQRLFELLDRDYGSQDLYIGLLMAIGMQPQTSVTRQQREVLADAALNDRLFRREAGDLIRAYAAHTLGRIGTRHEIRTLENVLRARRGTTRNVQRSAAIGLGLLGQHVDGSDRVTIAKVLLESYGRLKDNSTKNFVIMSLAYLLVDDITSSTTDLFGNTQADELLLQTAEKGSYVHKPFGALALGRVLRKIHDEAEVSAYETFRVRALRILRKGVVSRKVDKKTRGAFCTALGFARDRGSIDALCGIVADTKGDKELRGYAALGLGLIGNPTPEVMKTIADAMRERSTEELRRQSAVALGLLGNRKIPGTGKTAGDLLRDELKLAKSQDHKGQVVLALASIGDHRAVGRLVDILKNKGEQDLTRALACAGLGLIGDPEDVPSLARATENGNYRASTDLIRELASIL